MSDDDVRLVAPLVACGALPRAAAEECLKLWQSLAKEGRPVPLLAVMVKKGLLTRTQAIVLAMPDVRQSLLDLGIEPRPSTPAALHDLLVAEIDKWRAVIERAGIEPQ